jgi:alpha-L-rhamnosidase
MNFEVLKKQVEFIRSVFPTYIVYKDISDHESLDPKPEALTATAFYYQHVEILAEIARILDKQTDVVNYQDLSKEILTTCRNKFLRKGTGIFDNGTQAAQLFALYHNLVTENEQEAAMKHLIDEIFYKHHGHLSTGIFATKYLFDVCRIANRNDIAYSVANQQLFPGYGFMIQHGATTLWESWAYPDTVCSQNHPMFGSVSEWFYRSLLGINADEPGFRTFHIKPQPAGDLTWAKGYFDAVTGRISSEWKITGDTFVFRVSIPANTKAFIYVPSCEGGPVKEIGTQADLSDSLKFVEYRNGYALFKALSGNYTFASELVRN